MRERRHQQDRPSAAGVRSKDIMDNRRRPQSADSQYAIRGRAIKQRLLGKTATLPESYTQ